MLGDRQELEVGEAHVGDVGDQPVGELVPGEEAVAVAAPPGAEMHLVDRDRRAARIHAGADCHGARVAPGKPLGAPHDRGGRGPQLAAEGEGIGLERQHDCRPAR